MKKVLLILCLLPMFLMAQNRKTEMPQNKKVAILETVDKTGNINPAYKLMLRASLAKAITEADGWDAYDRVDLDAVMSEQDFQRTGMVRDDQIKQLGVMTGAQYVLIAEAVMADETTLFITAKIIDVETAQTMKAESQLMKANPEDIQIGCTTMAGNMLGIKLNSGITKPSSSSYSPTPNNSSTPKTTTPPTQSAPKQQIKWTGNSDLSFRVKSCKYNNSRCFIALALTNSSKNDMRIRIDFTTLKIYDTDGEVYQEDDGSAVFTQTFEGSKFAGKDMQFKTELFELPADMTVELKIAVGAFDGSATMIKLLQFGKLIVNNADGVLEIRNISVSK